MSYVAGWHKRTIDIEPRGHAMFGYGMWHHRARARQTALYARAIVLRDGSGRTFRYCLLDLGYVPYAIRSGVCDALRAQLGDALDEEALVVAATHTHSAPGGCSYEAMYNFVTPGFVTQHWQAVVDAASGAILAAERGLRPAQVSLHAGPIADDVEVAWNRSLEAYNRNPEVERRGETETHLAIDRQMNVIGVSTDGVPQAMLCLFGVHATCLGNTLDRLDGDNKGYAAAHAEAAMRAAGAAEPVAIFAQATCGDVSPHYHGPAQRARRAAIKGEGEYRYAEENGRRQSVRALELLTKTPGRAIEGEIDAIYAYADFSDLHVDPAFAGGRDDAYTSDPCHGVAFFRGTPVDGPGVGALLGGLARRLAERVRRHRLSPDSGLSSEERAYYERLYASQGNKAILLEAGKKRILGRAFAGLRFARLFDPLVAELLRQVKAGALERSPLVPTVLPTQVILLGDVALACAPGEFTTRAGAGVKDAVRARLAARGVREVLLCTYCNDFMGYVTTNAEYGAQAYEGGHTIFGQWTLGGFQTRFAALAAELCRPIAERSYDRALRPAAVPPEELARRRDLPVPK